MIYLIKPMGKDNLFWSIAPGYIWEVYLSLTTYKDPNCINFQQFVS